MNSTIILNHPKYGLRRAGVCIPLWSILSEKSFECGDIYSLRAILPWLKESGLSILQILPLNDCGIGKSPYSSLSSFAIDPLYISLELAGIPIASRKKVIASQKINKKRITELKLKYLNEKFVGEFPKIKKTLDQFIADNLWIKSYLCFRLLYIENNYKHWIEWEKKESYTADLFSRMLNEKSEQMYFYAWIQFLAYQQLKETKQLFEQNGVLLKGDMPILTSSNSADVWSQQEFFRLDLYAGAPPDAFSSIGQNWGFPILDWSALEKIDYQPWKERLQYQENFFHLYRIDHVIGMYRLWAIPKNAKNARFGFFFPQKTITLADFKEEELDPDEFIEKGFVHELESGKYYFHWDFNQEPGFNDFSKDIQEKLYKLSFQNMQIDEDYWEEKGDKVLSKFDDFTKMLPCAEDLGSVPGFVRENLQEKGLLGIDVIRWTRSFEDGSYIPADKYRLNSVSTLSTHDTSLAMDWWNNELKDGEKAYAKTFFLNKEEGENSNSLKCLLEFAFMTTSLYSIHLLQDLLFAGDYFIKDNFSSHKINTPGTEEEYNWDYRFRFTIEELCEDKILSSELMSLVKKSFRI